MNTYIHISIYTHMYTRIYTHTYYQINNVKILLWSWFVRVRVFFVRTSTLSTVYKEDSISLSCCCQ